MRSPSSMAQKADRDPPYRGIVRGYGYLAAILGSAPLVGMALPGASAGAPTDQEIALAVVALCASLCIGSWCCLLAIGETVGTEIHTETRMPLKTRIAGLAGFAAALMVVVISVPVALLIGGAGPGQPPQPGSSSLAVSAMLALCALQIAAAATAINRLEQAVRHGVIDV